MQALGASTGIVIGRAIIRDLYERERAASMIGLVTTVMVIAPMFAPALGGLLDTVFGWESIFVFLSAFNALVLVWAMRTLPETRADRPGETSNVLARLGAAAAQPDLPRLCAVRRVRHRAVLSSSSAAGRMSWCR